MFKTYCFPTCDMLLTASKESRSGRRASECVVAFRVWGLGGGLLKYMCCVSLCRVSDCVGGVSFRAPHLGVSLLFGFWGWGGG